MGSGERNHRARQLATKEVHVVAEEWILRVSRKQLQKPIVQDNRLPARDAVHGSPGEV